MVVVEFFIFFCDKMFPKHVVRLPTRVLAVILCSPGVQLKCIIHFEKNKNTANAVDLPPLAFGYVS